VQILGFRERGKVGQRGGGGEREREREDVRSAAAAPLTNGHNTLFRRSI